MSIKLSYRTIIVRTTVNAIEHQVRYHLIQQHIYIAPTYIITLYKICFKTNKSVVYCY